MTQLYRRPTLVVDLTRAEGRGAVLVLRGDLEETSVPVLRDALVDLATHGKSELVVDLSLATSVDQAGLDTLSWAQRVARGANGGLVAVCAPDHADRPALEGTLPVCDTVAEARLALGISLR